MAQLSLQQALDLAQSHYTAARLREAEGIYREILAQAPAAADAWHWLGLILCQNGQPEPGLGMMKHSIELDPAAHFLSNYSEALRRCGRAADAVEYSRRAVAMNPQSVDFHHNLALALQGTGQLEQATEEYQIALKLDPKSAPVTMGLGSILHKLGRTREAVETFRHAVALAPNLAVAHYNLGVLLQELELLAEAEATYRRALALDPNMSLAWLNLGNVLCRRDKADEGIAAYKEAGRLQPNSPMSYDNIGTATLNQHNSEEAIGWYQKAIAVKPDYAPAHSNLALAYLDLGRIDEALDAVKRSVELDPSVPESRNNVGNFLADVGRIEDAIDYYRQAIALKEKDGVFYSNLLMATHNHPKTDPFTLFQIHLEWDRRYGRPVRGLIREHRNSRDPNRRIKLGYVSADFRSHSISFFLEAILKNHNREQFEVTIYSSVHSPDHVTERFRGYADRWQEAVELSDDALADMIRADETDVLIDLSGHTSHNRLRVFAMEPAPVQVSYLGYPNTTGLQAMHWRITDAIADPPGAEALHTERLWRMKNTFLCYTPRPDVPDVGVPLRKADPPRPVTFVCFNAFNKITPELLDLWARVLHESPGTRFLLKSQGLGSQRLCEDVRNAFRRREVDPARIDLVARTKSTLEHLRMYQHVDLALDTYPYNGTTTTFESLWMGIPVVTLCGAAHVSRVSASILTTLGLEELIAHDEDSYVRIASELARDVERMESLRLTLRERMRVSPLMDGLGFTREFEAALREMWRDYCTSSVR